MNNAFRTIIVLVLVFTASTVNAESIVGTSCRVALQPSGNVWSFAYSEPGNHDTAGGGKKVYFIARPMQNTLTADAVLSTLELYEFELIGYIDENGNGIPDAGEDSKQLEFEVYHVGNTWEGQFLCVVFGCTFDYDTAWTGLGGGDDDDDDDDPPGGDETNDIIWADGCECGACCQCRCECGKWNMLEQGSCVGHSANNCTNPDGCNAVHQPHPDTGEYVQYHHCGCHDSGEDEDDDPPDDPPGGGEDEWKSPPDIPGFRNPGSLENPTAPQGMRPVMPVFAPVGSAGDWNMTYFSTKNQGDAKGIHFPEFQHEKLYERLDKKLSEKIDLKWMSKLSDPRSYGNVDLTWRIDFEVLGVKVGPVEFDLRKYLDDYSKTSICDILYFVCLFLLYAGLCIGVLRQLLYW